MQVRRRRPCHSIHARSSSERAGTGGGLPRTLPATCLAEDQPILDVGCGPGTVTLELARIARRSRLVGLEAAGGLVSVAVEAAKRAGVANADLASGVVMALPYDWWSRASHPNGWFCVVYGQVACRPPLAIA